VRHLSARKVGLHVGVAQHGAASPPCWRHLSARKASLHMGVARHGAASPPCRWGRVARADADMSACFARPDTP